MKNISAILLTLTLLGVSAETSFAQQQDPAYSDTLEYNSNIKGPLEFKGFVEELVKKLKGAIITLYESPDGSHENLTEVYRTVSPGNGMFEFKLEINKHFVLVVEKSGYTTKKVDFDTDVRLAREQYTKVPKFEFRVDMVRDLDGLPFVGSVAHVFYQIKNNTFNYQLDYTKEELENEEIERLEKERKQRESELAYQKKVALEEAAKLLLDKDNATAQQIIEASITVGDGDKSKTVKGFLDVFSEVDTLRDRKAEAMYAHLLEERKKTGAESGKIDFQAIFDAGKFVETEAESKAEEERQAIVSELRKEKEEAARIAKEALILQQKAVEELAKEQLATAIQEEELRKKKEKKEKEDEVYYAIFNAQGSSQEAIQNLIKTYSKSDEYREQKAKAIYEEYEKTRLTGTTLSNMNFGDLFNAADVAEQKAISEDIAGQRKKGSSALEAFKLKAEAQRKKEQEEISRKIEKGLVDAPKDRASQIEVFKNSLAKNDANKDLKAEVMYNQYVAQKKAIKEIEIGLKSAPKDADSQKAVFYNALPEDTPDREGTAQRMFESYTASKQAQGGTGTISMDFGSMFQTADEAVEVAKDEAMEKNALEKQQAQAALESRREDVRKEKQELAAKAEKQVESVHKAEMANAKNKKEKALASAIEKGGGDRDKTVEAISKALPETGDKQLDRTRSEAVYDAYLNESNAIEKSGRIGEKVDFAALFTAAEKAELESLQRKYEANEAAKAVELAVYEEKRVERATELAKADQKKAERDVLAAEKTYEETLLKTEVARQERLAEQAKKEEALAKEIAMEEAKRDVQEKELASGELAVVERERLKRLEAEEKAAADLAKAEEERRIKEELAAQKAADEQLALVARQKRKADEERLKQLKAKEDEEKRLALAKAKEEEAARKAEELALAEEQRKADATALAAKKAEAQRIKDEERQRIEAEKLAEAEALAAEKAEQERLKAEEERLAAAAKKKAEDEENARKASYDALISQGDLALSKNDYRVAYKNYQDAKAIFPDNKDVTSKLKEAETEVKRLDQEAADQLALETRYGELMQDAEQKLADNNFDAAKAKFNKASELKPDAREPKQKIRNIDRTLEQIASDKKAEAEKERRYIVLMQDGAKALETGSLADARDLYQQASRIKPNESEPKAKLDEIQSKEDELAAAAIEIQKRKDDAAANFAKDQAEAEKKKEEVLQARLNATAAADAAKMEAAKTDEEREKLRIAQFKKLQESLKEVDLNDDERRAKFLSELAKIYPEGLTEESVDGKGFVLKRQVINEDGVVNIYEKKTWDWGGVFYFKNTDIAITEAIYKLEIGKY